MYVSSKLSRLGSVSCRPFRYATNRAEEHESWLKPFRYCELRTKGCLVSGGQAHVDPHARGHLVHRYFIRRPGHANPEALCICNYTSYGTRCRFAAVKRGFRIVEGSDEPADPEKSNLMRLLVRVDLAIWGPKGQ